MFREAAGKPPVAITLDDVRRIAHLARIDIDAAQACEVHAKLTAIFGLIDSYLARRFPMAPRAGLTAAAGAITPCVLITVISSGALPPSALLPFAICGAASMGLCSLLTDCLGQPRPSQGYAVALFGD